MIASRRVSYSLLAIVPLLALTACGGGDDAQDSDVSATDSAAIVDQMAAGMEAAMQGGGGTAGPRLSTEQLEAKMPETVIGLQRTELTTMAMGAMNTTTARYEGDDERTVEISFIDAGAGAMGMAAGWTMATFNRTTQEGFERTADFGDLKAFEREERGSGSLSSELDVLAGNYIVTLRGQAVDIGILRGIAEDLELDEMAP